MKSSTIITFFLNTASICTLSNAFSIHPIQHSRRLATLSAATNQDNHQYQKDEEINKYSKNDSRRKFLEMFTLIGTTAVVSPLPGNALVKGNAPPPKKKASEERKCVNVEECQEMAERYISYPTISFVSYHLCPTFHVYSSYQK